jgi:hypothetical protein
MPHITFSEKLAASARFAYIKCEALYYHSSMLSDTFIYFARYVLPFASGSSSSCIDGGLLRFSYRRPSQFLLLCL